MPLPLDPAADSAPVAPPPAHRNNLDVLRLVLALAVIFSHSFPIATGSNDREPIDRITRHGWDVGKQAVVGFFAISGLLVAQSWRRTGGVGRFAAKRGLRILPGYAVCIAVCILIATPAVGSLAANWRPLTVCGLELEPLHAPQLLAANPYPAYLNGSIWTIRYELYCYLILAALGAAGALRRPVAMAAVFVASLSLILAGDWARHRQVALALTGVGDLTSWARFLPPFLAGAAVSSVYHRVPLRGWALCVAGAVMLVLFRFGLPTVARLMVPFVTVYGVLYVGFHPRLRLHRFGRYGDFSYGTYLYAWPIQQVLVAHTGAHLTPWMLCAAAAPLSLLAGVGSWFGVERLFLRSKPRPLPSTVPGNDAPA